MYYKITKNGQITNNEIKIRQALHLFRATLSSRSVETTEEIYERNAEPRV